MNIRPATKEDLPVCEHLFRVQELQFIGGDYANESFLEQFLDDNYFLVAEEERTIIGCVYGEPLKAEGVVLWMVAVSEEQRGKGIGKRLVKAFEHNCYEQGKEWMYLLGLDTEQHEKLYTSLGFTGGKKLVEYLKEPLEQ